MPAAARMILLATVAAVLAGCTMASDKYGLPPVDRTNKAYPNINIDPPARPPLDPPAGHPPNTNSTKQATPG